MGTCGDFPTNGPFLRVLAKSAGIGQIRPKSGESKVRLSEGTKGPNRAISLSEAMCWTNGSLWMRPRTGLGCFGGIAGPDSVF